MPYHHRRHRHYGRSRHRDEATQRVSESSMGIAHAHFSDLIVPDRTPVKLSYAQLGSFTATAAGYQVFRGNSVFDPDKTGVGSQPVGFDQWCTLYTAWVVLASAIEVVAVDGSAVAQTVTICPAVVDLSTTTITGLEIQQQPYAKMRLMGQTNGGHDLVHLKHYMSTSEILGLPYNGVRQDTGLSGSSTTNPPSQWFWNVYFDSIDNSSNITVNYQVRMTYYVEFFNRVALDQS